jgi:hypothetical protein
MTVPRTLRPAYPRPRSRHPAEATAQGGPVIPLPARPGGHPEQRPAGPRAGIEVVG